MFRSLDPDSANVLWSQEIGWGPLIVAGDKLILLAQDGQLRVAAADPAGYREYWAARLPKSTYETPPGLVGKRLYIRSAGELYCST